ncbi:MAG: STAS domain-containing protein [Phycisphaerales bacterium]|nr:STAS domain-containing protein [Phycisphaerales bacterium]
MATSFANTPSRRPFESFNGSGQYVTIRQATTALHVKITAPSVGQHEAPIISNEIFERLARAPGRCQWLALDLSDVSVVSSMGLALCLNVRSSAKERGMDTALYGMNAHLRGLFQMMKVERLYKLVHSKDDLRRLIEG